MRRIGRVSGWSRGSRHPHSSMQTEYEQNVIVSCVSLPIKRTNEMPNQEWLADRVTAQLLIDAVQNRLIPLYNPVLRWYACSPLFIDVPS
jgi:hypothetical protein